MDLLIETGSKFAPSRKVRHAESDGSPAAQLLLDFAQFEREMTADRTPTRCISGRRRTVNGGHAPYGYRAENKRLVVQRREAFVFGSCFIGSRRPLACPVKDELINEAGTTARMGMEQDGMDQIFGIPRTAVSYSLTNSALRVNMRR